MGDAVTALNDGFKLNLILILLVVILAVLLYVLLRATSLLDLASLQLDRAEYIGKTLLRGCNGTQI